MSVRQTKQQNGCCDIKFLIKIHRTAGAKKQFIFFCTAHIQDRIPKHTIQSHEKTDN